MKVLADLHHGALYKSLYLLFEKRLGYEMFRPIGQDWFTNGYFKVAQPYGDAQDTIDQYLAINDRTWNTFTNLNGDYKLKDEIYHIFDPENNIQHKAITFEKFKEMKFDLIVASHPLHGNWKDLLQYQPKAKFIQQIGNEGQTSNAENILCSTTDFIPNNQNIIYYHQEFKVPEYHPPTNHNIINSFVVSLPEPEVYNMYKENLKEFDMHAYGVGSPDGTISGNTIHQRMRDSAFGWHTKPYDGFGHVIWGWGFSGRPLIGNASYYKGKSAGCLWNDGITSIDLEKHSFEENLRLIREASQPEKHIQMCEAMAKTARENCNFDTEAKNIEGWLNNLIEKGF